MVLWFRGFVVALRRRPGRRFRQGDLRSATQTKIGRHVQAAAP